MLDYQHSHLDKQQLMFHILYKVYSKVLSHGLEINEQYTGDDDLPNNVLQFDLTQSVKIHYLFVLLNL